MLSYDIDFIINMHSVDICRNTCVGNMEELVQIRARLSAIEGF